MAKAGDFVVVANRLPVRRVGKKGRSSWEISPGGLVSALTPFLVERRGTWVGWTGIPGKAPVPFDHAQIRNVPVSLSKEEIDDYYLGFSNDTLWPLYHDCVRPPRYHRHWWRKYVAVNQRFAEVTAGVAAKGGVVWVHDYHLQLVPGMLRRLRPDLKIGFFLHIPLPPTELFAQLPWRKQVLEGMCGADLVGFQTEGGSQNFGRLVRRYGVGRGKGNHLQVDGRTVLHAHFPISIDFDRFQEAAASPETEQKIRALRKRIGEDRRILLGIDRLDYTKGIDIRLKAYRELIEHGHASLDDIVMVQVATPSRESLDFYQQEKDRIEQTIGEINGSFSAIGRVAVHYLHKTLPFDEMVALYRVSDVMMVTPLRDGMNLVAKEYVACHADGNGVLVLSEFAGAAAELKNAIHVNPHDTQGVMEAIQTALTMAPAERRRRMRRMHQTVAKHSVFDWASEFLGTLEAHR
jgi:trehalose 6-phosphate synthase